MVESIEQYKSQINDNMENKTLEGFIRKHLKSTSPESNMFIGSMDEIKLLICHYATYQDLQKHAKKIERLKRHSGDKPRSGFKI